ncbi:glycosyltransferase [Ruoffia tabacinasalis]|uniref:glycosyltransferase n=1 Tax=Ruoffia tabacinasalis TaxID=87458 RepID=UPI0030D05FE8
MKYVLHYVEKMDRGGMESYIMNVYRNIDRSKYQFHFIVHTNKKSDFDEEILSLGGKILRVPTTLRSNPIKYIRFWKRFWVKNQKKYDVFHFHTNSLANIYAIKAAQKIGYNKIIIHSHSTGANKGKIQKIHDLIHLSNQKYVLRNKFKLVAVSENASDWLFGKEAIIAGKVRIVSVGIDYSLFYFNSQVREKIRKQYDLDKSIVIGHVGNFFAVKNHEFIIETFYELAKFNDNISLLLIGDGDTIQESKELVNKLKLKDNVTFTGNIENVSDFYNAMDIFIFPSKYEGLGMSMVEAQINGLPVFYSDTVPFESVISNNTLCLNLNSGSNNWAKEIQKYFTKERSREIEVNNKFNIANSSEKLTLIYEEVSDGKNK